MRALRFLPLAFLANVDGFVLFAPYLVLMMALAHVLWAVRRRREGAAALLARPVHAVRQTPPVRAMADGDMVPALG